jgi:hypothetical protein
MREISSLLSEPLRRGPTNWFGPGGSIGVIRTLLLHLISIETGRLAVESDGADAT